MRHDLLTLRLFVATCEEQSIAKAAERENIAASAVSKRLSDLEAVVNNTLIYRRSTGLELTAAGQALLRHAREILRDLAQMENEMTSFTNGAAGNVRMYANSWATALYLPHDLARFMAKHPDIRIDLEQEVSPVAIRALNENKADLAIMGGDYLVPQYVTLPYRAEEWTAITPLDHPLASRTSIKLADMLPHDFVGVTQGSAIDTLVMREAARIGKVVRLRIRVTGFEAVGAMVEAGLGVSIVPGSWVERYATSIRVARMRLEEVWALRRLVICVRTLEDLTPAARLLVDHLRSG
ncbi:LysR substrate-binding domain-containing protein [Acidisphaera sp. L21]|uniref:LysR substrate-binding domain-containing protein n=1 Tax=Acidisphaera sp. L21 TaxID=1641851 RepID=UPI00131DBAF5|nr:LysR substrate-binding domain-containing protein [Acidisphaera sp. L21]